MLLCIINFYDLNDFLCLKISCEGAMLLANKKPCIDVVSVNVCFWWWCVFLKNVAQRREGAMLLAIKKTCIGVVSVDVCFWWWCVFLKNVAQRRCFGKSSKGAILIANEKSSCWCCVWWCDFSDDLIFQLLNYHYQKNTLQKKSCLLGYRFGNRTLNYACMLKKNPKQKHNSGLCLLCLHCCGNAGTTESKENSSKG